MRYLVLADIHANIDALDAVLRDAAGAGYGHVLLLGDLVGYGAAASGR
jgi:predicted phosphodiesterase